jgi:hypothetical protein
MMYTPEKQQEVHHEGKRFARTDASIGGISPSV